MKYICIMGADIGHKDGISRVVSDLSLYFKDKVMIFTSQYNHGISYKISRDSKVYEINPYPGELPTSWIKCWKIARIIRRDVRREDDIIFNTHNINAVIPVAIIRLLLINRKSTISAFIYDSNELIFRKNRLIGKVWKKLKLFLISLLIKINIVDDIFVLDNKMKQLIYKTLYTNKVRIIRIGVSSSIVELSQNNKLNPSEKFKKIIKNKCKIKLFFHGK